MQIRRPAKLVVILPVLALFYLSAATYSAVCDFHHEHAASHHGRAASHHTSLCQMLCGDGLVALVAPTAPVPVLAALSPAIARPAPVYRAAPRSFSSSRAPPHFSA